MNNRYLKVIKKISVSILFLIIAVIIYGCEGVDLGGGSPSGGVIFKITDNTGQIEFMTASEERVLLSIIEEKGYSIPGLEVTIFTDGKSALNSLIMIIDPKRSYVPYIFSPSEDDIIAKRVGDNKAQYTVTRYITRQMIDIEEAVDKEGDLNPIYRERLANLDRYLISGGYYEKKFTCPGNELNSHLKEYWDNSDLKDKTCLSSLEEKFLAHLALKENEEVMLNIFKIDEIRQEQDYLKGGYVLNQLFEVYYPKMSNNKVLPFPIIRPQGEPTNIPPMVDIEADKVQGSPPLQVRFVANVYDEDGYIASYSWDFGDGTTSNEQAPTHIYERRGLYTAVCKVSDNSGAYAEDWVKVEVNNPPLIFVTANPTSGNPPLVVQFRADAFDSDGSIRGYNWDFGDGTASNEQNPSHV